MTRYRPVIFLVLAAGALATTHLTAQWWNPVDWFSESKVERLAKLEPATPEEEDRAKALYDEGMAALRNGNKSKAKNRFDRIRDHLERTRVAPDAVLRIAGIQADDKRYQKAFKTAQSVISRYPDYPGFNEVIRLQFEIATQIMEGQRSRIFGIIPKFQAPERARGYFEVVVANAPYSDYAPMALMNIALVSRDVNEEEYAVDALDRLINFYPNTMFGPDAYFTLAEIFSEQVDGPYYDQSSTRQAINFYEDFLLLYPNNPRAAEAEAGLEEMQEVFAQSKFLLGDYYYKYRFNTTAALVFYNETITEAPNSESARLARERIDRIRAGARPPRAGLGLAQLWKRLRPGDDEARSAGEVAREREELGESVEIESEVIPAPSRPSG